MYWPKFELKIMNLLTALCEGLKDSVPARACLRKSEKGNTMRNPLSKEKRNPRQPVSANTNERVWLRENFEAGLVPAFSFRKFSNLQFSICNF
jgi:hypothetical protein